jgi:hypothetical protein
MKKGLFQLEEGRKKGDVKDVWMDKEMQKKQRVKNKTNITTKYDKRWR